MSVMKGPLFQLSIGGLLGFAVLAGIEGRSWGVFFGFALIALYFFAIGASRQAARSTRRPVRIAGNVVASACALLFLGMILMTVERLYLVNGSSYPRILAHDLGAANYSTLENLRLNQCKGDGMEIYGKRNDLWVIRCGFSWYEGHTYISTTNPYGHMLDGIDKKSQGAAQ